MRLEEKLENKQYIALMQHNEFHNLGTVIKKIEKMRKDPGIVTKSSIHDYPQIRKSCFEKWKQRYSEPQVKALLVCVKKFTKDERLQKRTEESDAEVITIKICRFLHSSKKELYTKVQ